MLKWTRGLVLILVVLATDSVRAAGLEEKLKAMDDAIARIYDGDPVTLEECVEIAILGSAVVAKWEEDQATADADVLAAYGAWLPNLSANGSWSKGERTDLDQEVFTDSETVLTQAIFVDSNQNPLELQIGGEDAFIAQQVPTNPVLQDQTSRSTTTQGSVRTAWTVFSGFSRFAGMSRAKLDRESTVAQLDYQKQLLVELVGNAYLDLARAVLKVGVAEDAEDLAQRELEKSETYFELGISTRSDVLQQKVSLQQSRLATVQARGEQRNAFASLVHLMNIPGARDFTIDTNMTVGNEMTVPELAPLLAHARGNRQDLRYWELNAQARGKGVTEARSSLYPSVEVFASYGRTKQELPQSLRFGSTEVESLSWGIQGSWNIFDRFQTKNASRRAVATKRKAEYDVRQAELDMEKEIVQLRNNLIESTESFAVATQTVEQSTEELRLAQERFRVGAGTSLDVINAQVSLAQARRDVVDAQTNYAKFYRQLQRATGGAI